MWLFITKKASKFKKSTIPDLYIDRRTQNCEKVKIGSVTPLEHCAVAVLKAFANCPAIIKWCGIHDFDPITLEKIERNSIGQFNREFYDHFLVDCLSMIWRTFHYKKYVWIQWKFKMVIKRSCAGGELDESDSSSPQIQPKEIE